MLSDFTNRFRLHGYELIGGPLDGQWSAGPLSLGRSDLRIMDSKSSGLHEGAIITYWHIYRTRFFDRTKADYIGTETRKW